jgi:hypothetical protein
LEFLNRYRKIGGSIDKLFNPKNYYKALRKYGLDPGYEIRKKYIPDQDRDKKGSTGSWLGICSSEHSDCGSGGNIEIVINSQLYKKFFGTCISKEIIEKLC